MADVVEVKELLHQVCRYVRVVRRCLGGVRDHAETAEKAVSLLCDILELLYSVKDQLSGSNEKCPFDSSLLAAIHELLTLFEATLQLMERNFHPGGVGVREFRTYLLERTMIPRLEQYKVAFLLATQTDSPYVPCEKISTSVNLEADDYSSTRERSLTETDIYQRLRQFYDMETSMSFALFRLSSVL